MNEQKPSNIFPIDTAIPAIPEVKDIELPPKYEIYHMGKLLCEMSLHLIDNSFNGLVINGLNCGVVEPEMVIKAIDEKIAEAVEQDKNEYRAMRLAIQDAVAGHEAMKITAPREEIEAIINKIKSNDELDTTYCEYFGLHQEQWFKNAFDRRFNELLREQYLKDAQILVTEGRFVEKSTDKKKGFLRLFNKERTEIIYGYGEIHLNQVIKIMVIYGNSFISPQVLHTLPMGEWSVAFANDDKEFVQWLADNDYAKYQLEVKQRNQAQNVIQERNLSHELQNEVNTRIEIQVDLQKAEVKLRHTQIQLEDSKIHPILTMFKNLFSRAKPSITDENLNKIREQAGA